MRIFKILNNNVAIIREEGQKEKVVMGRGICFQKRAGDEILESAIDKTFALSDPEARSRFQELIKDIPPEHMELGEEIISEAEKRLGRTLNDMLYISLIDHIYTAVARFLDGITVKNMLLWDIRRFYREEYALGVWALDLIEKRFKVRLPEDEAGFIALHIVNAGMDEQEVHNMFGITKLIQEIENIVKYNFHMDFDEEDVYYYRFITHLKFFAKRLLEAGTYEEDGQDDLLEIIKTRYRDAFGCVEKIAGFIRKKYGQELSADEKLYLTIHIARVVEKTRRK